MSLEPLRNLDPDLLHLVVFGPGFGESVLVRVPPDAWLVVDCLRQRGGTQEDVPAASLLDIQGSSAAAVVLTHPHLDHADGLPHVLDRRVPGGPVGCLATNFEPPERWRGNPDSERELAGAGTEAALQRIFDIWEQEPEARWDLTTDVSRPLGDGNVCVVHPPANRAVALARGSDPNRASSPLLIEWGDARVLLGADLPNVEWRRVPQSFARSASLATTPVLKVAHHCSGKAQHEVAIGRSPRTRRACLATPWTKGAKARRLPRFEPDEGVDVLLRIVDEILLSSMPNPYDLARGQRLTRAVAESSRQQERVGEELILDREAAPPAVTDAWVHVALARSGDVEAVRLGPAAVTLVP